MNMKSDHCSFCLPVYVEIIDFILTLLSSAVVPLQWVQEIKEACPGTPYLLIGCKNDLRTDSALQFHLAVPGQEMDDNLDSVSRIKVNCSS